jgi:KUP system potassium uptake protein
VILAIASVALVLGFRSSSALSAAYGMAVIGTMATTSTLMFAIQYEEHRWNLVRALLVALFFLAIDSTFLVGNLSKFLDGGWLPVVVGVAVLAVLTTWKRGTEAVRKFTFDSAIPLSDFMKQLHGETVPRVKGSAMFIMSSPEHTPRVLLHHLKHNKILHEQVILMSVVTENVPAVSVPRQLAVADLGNGFLRITAHCGFMQTLDMREILRLIQRAGVKLKGDISYFIGHMTLTATGRAQLPVWRKLLFAFLFHNERSPTNFLGIPPNRVVELGEQAEL